MQAVFLKLYEKQPAWLCDGAERDSGRDQLAANGAATGTYEKDGVTYVYQVSGEPGNWRANVEAESSPSAER